MNAPAECRRCGVCCFSRAEAYVRVTGEDWTRLGDRAEAVAHFIGNRAFMRMAGGHCAALEVRRDTDGVTDYFCGIYERRPQVCRDLARGSPECEGERATKKEWVERSSHGIPAEELPRMTRMDANVGETEFSRASRG